ncbi:MAG: GGDEF domain-containing protein [Solirubrobacteraceae bacterium]|nr:GGDEF domain-containing protein [Solirubrobacteraceae bacterium]
MSTLGAEGDIGTTPMADAEVTGIRGLLHRAGLIGYPEAADEPVPLARKICRGVEGRLMTAALLILIGLFAYPFGLILDVDDPRLLGAVGVVGILAGLVVAAMRTAEIHERWFDVLCVTIGVLLTLGVAAAQPYGGAVTPLFTFLGPTIAFVIIQPRARLVYAILGSVAILLPVILMTGTTATTAASCLALAVTWGLGLFVALVWDGADRQTRRLEELVRADPLTGVGNRRLLDERLRYELRRHARTDRSLALVVLDLNRFKEVNDTLGHHAGDELLQEVAHVLQATVREQDTVVRAGGDEFCVLLPETGREAAAGLVAKLHAAFAGIDAGGQPLTSAIGAAVYPDDAAAAGTLFEIADARQRDDKHRPVPRDPVPAVADHEPGRRAMRLLGLLALADDLENVFVSAGPADGVQETVARRVTRLRSVRYAVSLAFAGVGVLALMGGLFWFDDRLTELLLCAVMTFATAAVVPFVPTDRMDARWFHALPILVTLEMTVGLVLLGDEAYTVLPIVAFLGSAIAFVVDSRRAVVAHLLFGTAVLGSAVLWIGTGPVIGAALCALTVLVWSAMYVELTWRSADEQSEHLGELMRRDPLTGVGNRRLLTERVDYELRRHTRTGRPLTLFALDLNGFKQVNDTLGHAAGDDLLREAALALRRAVRDQDTVIRQGGDEFALIAPETGPAEARTLARGMRAALAQVMAAGEPLTSAIGFATFPDDATSAADLAHTADIRQLADKPHGSRRARRPAGQPRP